MDAGVHRQELLAALGAVLQDSDAMSWGAQCNRAIRLVYPLVDMKRKGKYKAYPFLLKHVCLFLCLFESVGILHCFEHPRRLKMCLNNQCVQIYPETLDVHCLHVGSV